MTANKHYQEFMRAKIRGAITEAEAASMLTHQGVKGTVLEILISRLFRPLLPADLGVGTGQIIDQHGHISNQVDIILYDRTILPPALYDDHTGLFPIEAVLYTIEVKTTLTRSGLTKAHEAAKKINHFAYMSGLRKPDGTDIEHNITRAHSVVFALKSDVSVAEAERYHGIYTKLADSPYLNAICVANKEYCYDDGRRWVVQSPAAPFDEILTLLGGMMNTYKKTAASRRQPLLGYYIVPVAPTKHGPSTGHSGVVTVECQTCSKKVDAELSTQDMDLTEQNGPFALNAPKCAHCDGVLIAPAGVYKFKYGSLRDVITATLSDAPPLATQGL